MKNILKKVGWIFAHPSPEQVMDLSRLKLPETGFPPALLAGGSENRLGWLRQ